VSIRRLVVACATVFAALMSASNADPCSQGIARVQAQFDAKLQANAAVGPSARESVAATMNRQPTPESIDLPHPKLTRYRDMRAPEIQVGAANCNTNGSTSLPNSVTIKGTLWAISPEMKCTSRLSRSSLDTITGPPAFFAALMAAANWGRRSRASAPLPLSCSSNAPVS
jgi:hypothetical protein